MRESGIVAQGISLVIWLTPVTNTALWWQLQDRLFESVRRQRLGKSDGRFVRFIQMLGRPVSSGSMLVGNAMSEFEALTNQSDDAAIEKQRPLTLLGFAAFGGVALLGLIVVPTAIGALRDWFPGMLLIWSVLANVVVMAGWAALLRGARASGTGAGLQRIATVVGLLIGAASIALLIALSGARAGAGSP